MLAFQRHPRSGQPAIINLRVSCSWLTPVPASAGAWLAFNEPLLVRLLQGPARQRPTLCPFIPPRGEREDLWHLGRLSSSFLLLLPRPAMVVCFFMKGFHSVSVYKAGNKGQEPTEKKLEITKPNFQLVQTGPDSATSKPNHHLERCLCSLTQPTLATRPCRAEIWFQLHGNSKPCLDVSIWLTAVDNPSNIHLDKPGY